MPAPMPQLAASSGPPVEATPRTICAMFAETADKYPYNRALISTYQPPNDILPPSQDTIKDDNNKDPPPAQPYLTWTYAHLSTLSTLLANALRAHHKIRAGTRIAVFLPNGAEWVLLFWAAVKLGAVFVPLDARSVRRSVERDHFLRVVRPGVVVLGDAGAARMEGWEGVGLRVLVGGERLPWWWGLGALMEEERVGLGRDGRNGGAEGLHEIDGPEADVESLLYIVFTSGTSGLPKACPRTNRNTWAAMVALEGLGLQEPADLVLQFAPPSHVMGMQNMIVAWLKGATIVLPSVSFDAKATLDAISKLKCTHMTVVPTMLQAILKQPGYHPEKMRSMQRVILGATIVLPSFVAAIKDPKIFGVPGVSLGFGMSEGLPICGGPVDEEMKIDRGAVGQGRTLAGAKVRIYQGGSREILTRGEVGELHFAGDMVIEGYGYGDNEPFYDDDEGHWIATGDQAMMDGDGVIFILGRYKDIIIRGGENLSPALIESCIGQLGLPGQVVGIPDDIAGEIPLAVLQVPARDQIPTLKIKALIMDRLGPTCLPTAYLTLAELGLTSFPLTTSGKVLKTVLRQRVLDYLSEKSMSSFQASCGPVSNAKMNGVSTTVSQLVITLGSLIGQPADTIPLEQPLSTIIDSINILRFQASIQKAIGKDVSLNDLLGTFSLSELATRIDVTPAAAASTASIQKRQGPPAAAEMVHTLGNPSCAARTQVFAENLLARHNMLWADVEDVLPIPDLSCAFEAMRPMSFSIRSVTTFSSCSPVSLQRSLGKTLERWSMFRSLAMKFDNIPLFVIVRPCEAMSQASISMLPEVERPDKLYKLRFPKAEDNNVHLNSGGPLARFAITNIKDTDSASLIMLVHHAIFDALSLQAFMRDLESNLSNNDITEPYTDYKLFADTFYLHSNSTSAQNSIAYHVNRLRGISFHRETSWPPQRCPGWFIGDDTGYSIPTTLQNSLLQPRSQMDSDEARTTVKRIQKTATLPDLPALRSKHISAPILFKAACALLNTRHTGVREALFSNSQAGRQWPFLSQDIANYLPNPVTIAGNTLGLVMNRISVSPDESVGSFLTRLEEEQHLLTQHAHAPTAAIVAQLNPGDAAAFQGGRKQLLNWNPALADLVASEGKAVGKLLLIDGFTDVMLAWHCGVVRGNTAVLIAEWDGAQFARDVAEGWAEEFVGALRWVGREENWERRLGEMEWEG